MNARAKPENVDNSSSDFICSSLCYDILTNIIDTKYFYRSFSSAKIALTCVPIDTTPAVLHLDSYKKSRIIIQTTFILFNFLTFYATKRLSNHFKPPAIVLTSSAALALLQNVVYCSSLELVKYNVNCEMSCTIF